jgi:hypothetical protein
VRKKHGERADLAAPPGRFASAACEPPRTRRISRQRGTAPAAVRGCDDRPRGRDPKALSRRAPARSARGTSAAPPAVMKDMTSVNALDLLRSQHDEVEDLIDDIEGSDDPGKKADLFRALADKLAAHSAIEEKIFYPSVMTGETREQLIEATEEHLAVKRLLADMMQLDANDEHFDAKLTVLKENVRHHAHDEEEDKLFLEVEAMMDDDELAALGNELLAMYELLIEGSPRQSVPAETKHAAELHV